VNKWLLWGGAGAAALVGGFMLLRGGSAPAASADSGSGGYYPPMVFGSGGGTVASDSSGTSTDNSIAQLIAGNLAVAQEQSSMTKYTSDNDKAVALATLGTQQTIASNDNANKLALQLNNNKTAIQQALAAQLGNISATLGTKQGLAGSLGFVDDKIVVDLKGTSRNSKTGAWS
jgi:hypothetical protein